MKNGAKGKRGCHKGQDCEYLHPILCKYSVKKKECFNKDCTYPHLVGTSRKPVDRSAERDAPRKSALKPRARTFSERSDTSIKSTKSDAKVEFTRNRKKSSSKSEDNFLELKGLIEAMNQKFMEEIQLIKANTFHQNLQGFYPQQGMFRPVPSQQPAYIPLSSS